LDSTDEQGFRVHSFAEDDWRICRDHVAALLGSTIASRAPHVVEEASKTDFGLQLFKEATDANTPTVLSYLRSRGLGLPEDYHQALRFHPACPFGRGTRHPCIVALYRDIKTNEPRAIHRTALTPDGRKIGRKALGPKAGCAIKLTLDEDVTEGLTIAEGIETVLAGMALNFRPAWALGDAGSIAKFPVLSGIKCLTILVDNDASGTGQSCAIECSRRWTGMGREVFRVVPTAVGQDMADIIRVRAA